ncbi:MAG TPA: hypothetical protein VMK83_07245 [Gaiellaceae bacterium]|nr:hypothetical protein [Gaiellaceae bacterium]
MFAQEIEGRAALHCGMAEGARTAAHWDAAYTSRGFDGVSWYQAVPTVSLELIEELRVRPDAAVIDVGGGTSFLVDHLFGRGFTDLAVLDVSAAALEAT